MSSLTRRCQQARSPILTAAMARHVPSRAAPQDPVKDPGELSALHPRTRNGEASIPRSSPPLYLSTTSSLICHALEGFQSHKSFDESSHDEDYGNNYSLQAGSSRDTGADLEQALRAMNINGTDNETAANVNCKPPYAHYGMAEDADPYYLRGRSIAHNHLREAGVQFPEPQGESSEIVNQSSVPRISIGLPLKQGEEIEQDPFSNALGEGQNVHMARHLDLETKSLGLGVCESVKATGTSFDDSALADPSYRESCYLGLGTWHSTDSGTRADTPDSLLEASPLSGDELTSDPRIDSGSLLLLDCNDGFIHAAGNTDTGGSHSRRSARQSSGTSSDQSVFTHSQSSGNGRKKQSLGTGGDEEEGGEENSGNKDFKGSEASPKPFLKRLACPFLKHDSAYFSYNGTPGRFRSCSGAGFRDTTRLKEHLYRRHVICPCCQKHFAEQGDLDAHLVEKDLCEEVLPGSTRGITPDMKKELKKRSLPSDSEEEKWKKIYRVIFPRELFVPSPFHGYNNGDREDFTTSAGHRMLELLIQYGGAILDQMQADQRSELLKIVMRCQKEIWDPCGASDTATRQDVNNGGDNIANMSTMLEPPWTPRTVDTSQSSLVNNTPRQPNSSAYSSPENIFSPTSTGCPETPQDLTMQETAGIRSSLEQRALSHSSDSGLVTSCSCYQCNENPYERCLVGAKSPAIRPLYPGHGDPGLTDQPMTIDPALLQIQRLSNPPPDASRSTFRVTNSLSEGDFQFEKYSGYHPSLQNQPGWQ